MRVEDDALNDPACPTCGATGVDSALLTHLQVAARELAEASWPDEEPTDDTVREVLARFLRGEVVLANES